MDKCNICAQLRAVGETPACVRNCPGRALHVGDINDPDSEVSRLLRDTPAEFIPVSYTHLALYSGAQALQRGIRHEVDEPALSGKYPDR